MLKRSGLALAALTVASLFTAASSARANVDVTYTTSFAPTTINVPPVGTPDFSLALTGTTGSVTAPLVPAFNDFAAGTIVETSNNSGAFSDTVNADYTITVVITDPSGTHTATLTGTITGTVSSTGTGSFISNLTSTVPGPVTTDTGLYIVTGIAGKYFTAPGASPAPAGSSGLPGSFTLDISVVPEPTSMVLMGLGGIGALGLFRRRKAQKKD